MSDEPLVVLQLSLAEVSQLAALVAQFAELLDESRPSEDPALDRLAPDAYPDDADASAEFHRLTRGDLLSRRADDAGAVRRSLDESGAVRDPSELDDDTAAQTAIVTLDHAEATSWMRTLTAVRLVLASRLGIEHDEHATDDPRAVVYDWLGMLLEGVVAAVTPDDPLTAP